VREIWQKSGSARKQLFYEPSFVDKADHKLILEWLATLHPIWEMRFSTLRPPPFGEEQRSLLRPVYWLGNWQFACLDYYRPPNGVENRCVRAESFPPVLARLVAEVEKIARGLYRGDAMPAKWRLNTCLVNFYGDRQEESGKWVDCARVGAHKDFEPGPVASISLGEKALFQFVSSQGRGDRRGAGDRVVSEQWLEDSSLQIFGGDRWKRELFHRVQRVDHRARVSFDLRTERFRTRRINFTFRYVPERHIVQLKDLPEQEFLDVEGYVVQLAKHSPFFAAELKLR
jgi:alkylated DNA repair protein (DNA oxidative demethylase)